MINVVMNTSAVPGSNSFSLSKVLILFRRAVENCFLNGIQMSETEHVSVGPRHSNSRMRLGEGRMFDSGREVLIADLPGKSTC